MEKIVQTKTKSKTTDRGNLYYHHLKVKLIYSNKSESIMIVPFQNILNLVKCMKLLNCH